MSHRSKYQQLPTEAINPATLGIDKASSADIIEMMLNDDRKVLAAVQREKPRIAIGVDIIVESLRKRRPRDFRWRRHKRPAWRRGISGDADHVWHQS